MISFKIAAKTDVGRVRDNNEDNFQAADDLSAAQMRWVNNQVCSLGTRGALLVVADGMGGTNAGEVASEIAISTIRDWFTPQRITDEVVKNRYSIERFMKEAVVEADNRIKTTAKENPASRNMGTTIVIGWLFDGVLYVSWCGDSRAYVYNPIYGLRQISKDHSYVQELVDQGKISQEDAFDFPDSNIITRCLSDSTTKARPECLVKPHTVCNGDIILLCSDGLNGMLRDSEIEQILSSYSGDMLVCADTLIQSACNAGGHDNVTVALCQILSGGIAASLETAPQATIGKGGVTGLTAVKAEETPKNNMKLLYISIAVVVGFLLIGAAAAMGYYFGANKDDNTEKTGAVNPVEEETSKIKPDTMTVEETSTPSEETNVGSHKDSGKEDKRPIGTSVNGSQSGLDALEGLRNKFSGEKTTQAENTTVDEQESENLTPISDSDSPDPSSKPSSDTKHGSFIEI